MFGRRGWPPVVSLSLSNRLAMAMEAMAFPMFMPARPTARLGDTNKSSVSSAPLTGRGGVDIAESRGGGLTRASLLCCGLFVVEDPGIIAARRALGDVWTGTASGVAIDVVLGVTMTGYNYAASRYVVTVGELRVDLHDRARHRHLRQPRELGIQAFVETAPRTADLEIGVAG